MSRDISKASENQVSIVGKILDMTSYAGKTNDDREYESLHMTVRVHQSYTGQDEVSEIEVSQFAMKYSKKDPNKINPGWDNLQKAKVFKTAQDVGIENADTIVLDPKYCSLRENNFIAPRSGSLISTWQLNASFSSNFASNKPEVACFRCDLFIMDMHDEMDRDGDPTGRLIVKGGVIGYGGTLNVFDFVVEDPTGVDYIQRTFSIQDTINVQGRIRVVAKEMEAPTDNDGWGEVIPQTTTRTIRELVITHTAGSAYEEEFAYDPTDIKKAYQERKARIEQIQQDAMKKQAKEKKNDDEDFDWAV